MHFIGGKILTILDESDIECGGSGGILSGQISIILDE